MQQWPSRRPFLFRRLIFAVGLGIVFSAVGYALGTHERELVSFWMLVGGFLLGISGPWW